MKEEWYQLQAAVSKVPQHNVLLIMGDINANTSSDNTDRERAMGREGCGIINDNGEKQMQEMIINWLYQDLSSV